VNFGTGNTDSALGMMTAAAPPKAPKSGFSTAMAASALSNARKSPFLRSRRDKLAPRPFTRPPVARENLV